MNTNLASFIVGIITDENDRFYFVQKDGQTYALSKEEGQHELGQSVKGFAYSDMKQKLRLTTLEVTATQEQFGWGTVTEVRKDLGGFVDTGLPDKQIVVSLARCPVTRRFACPADRYRQRRLDPCEPPLPFPNQTALE